MFGGPLFGPDVQPAQAGATQPQQMQGSAMGELSGPSGPGQQPYGFEQALSDVLDFLGMGGTEQAEQNQILSEQEAEGQGVSPYQPRESANMLDRRAEAPDPLTESYKRYGPDPKTAAARISLLPRGVAPFASAAFDVATGQNNPRGLDFAGLYRKRQTEANMLEKDQSPAVNMVRQNLPLIAGGVAGALPGRAAGLGGVMAGMGRGMGAGGIIGGVEGYFEPSNDGEDLLSMERAKDAAISGGLGMMMGGTAGIAGHVGGELTRQGFSKLRGKQLAGNAQPNPQAPPPGPRRPLGPPDEQPLSDWARPTGTERKVEAHEKRFNREMPALAKSLGMSADELRQRIAVSKRGGDFNAPLKPAEPRPPASKATKAEQGGLSKAVEPKKEAVASQPEPKAPDTKPKLSAEARRMRADLQGKTPLGRRIRAEVEEKTRLDQARGDAIALGNNYRSLNELTGGPRANVRIVPDRPSTERRFNAPGERGTYTPAQKRGPMQISEDIAKTSGRQPSQWTREDKEAFASAAAKHTSLSPAKIKSMLTSYGDGPRATRGLSNRRIREIVEAERIKARTEK